MTDVQRIYEKWWLNKYLEDGRRIVKVKFHGPPSGFYGSVVLTLDDGSEVNAPQGPYDFRPRKKNLTVFDKRMPTCIDAGCPLADPKTGTCQDECCIAHPKNLRD